MVILVFLQILLVSCQLVEFVTLQEQIIPNSLIKYEKISFGFSINENSKPVISKNSIIYINKNAIESQFRRYQKTEGIFRNDIETMYYLLNDLGYSSQFINVSNWLIDDEFIFNSKVVNYPLTTTEYPTLNLSNPILRFLNLKIRPTLIIIYNYFNQLLNFINSFIGLNINLHDAYEKIKYSIISKTYECHFGNYLFHNEEKSIAVTISSIQSKDELNCEALLDNNLDLIKSFFDKDTDFYQAYIHQNDETTIKFFTSEILALTQKPKWEIQCLNITL